MNMIEALDYARSIVKRPEDIKAIHLAIEPEAVPALQEKWRKYASDIPLICLESPYRSLSEPLLKFLKKVGQEHPHSFLTIIIPEFVTKTWVERLLHNQTTLFLKKALNEKKYRVISSVRYYLK